MKTTRYFDDQVRRKRPYIELGWRTQVIAAPLHWEKQPDGRLHFWGEVTPPGETTPRYLRVITLEDGETIHNAFFDRNYRREEQL